MCTDCGCGDRPTDQQAGAHGHDHPDHHEVDSDPDGTLVIRRRILQHNDDLATHLRAEFRRQDVYVVNVVSSPGSGKTELLQRTMAALQPGVRVAAVTGDLATENDADRLATAGAPVRQILTGTMCHLEADMVADAIADWDLAKIDILFIENVGNMVCPSGFDLGEDLRVMLVSTTEGEDKPLKYPTLTLTADVAVISKIDLAGPVECDVDLLASNLDEVRPGIEVVRTSAKLGDGIDRWIELLRTRMAVKAAAAPIG